VGPLVDEDEVRGSVYVSVVHCCGISSSR